MILFQYQSSWKIAIGGLVLMPDLLATVQGRIDPGSVINDCGDKHYNIGRDTERYGIV